MCQLLRFFLVACTEHLEEKSREEMEKAGPEPGLLPAQHALAYMHSPREQLTQPPSVAIRLMTALVKGILDAITYNR